MLAPKVGSAASERTHSPARSCHPRPSAMTIHDPLRVPGSGVDGVDAEPLATTGTKCLEVTPIQRRNLRGAVPFGEHDDRGVRSEERRVGKECRSRWSPYH